MNFGEALESLKIGNKVARQGWNGKNAWIVMMPSLYLPPFNTQDTNRKVNDRTAKHIGEDKPLDSQPYIAMWTAQGQWQPGWLPSQQDLFAEDWSVVLENKNSIENLISEIDKMFSEIGITDQKYKEESVEILKNYVEGHSNHTINNICTDIINFIINTDNLKAFLKLYSTRYGLITASFADYTIQNGSRELLNSDSSILNKYLKTLK